MKNIIVIILESVSSIGEAIWGIAAGIIAAILMFVVSIEFLTAMWFWLILEFLFIWFVSKPLARGIWNLTLSDSATQLLVIGTLPLALTILNCYIYLSGSNDWWGVLGAGIFFSALVITCSIAVDNEINL